MIARKYLQTLFTIAEKAQEPKKSRLLPVFQVQIRVQAVYDVASLIFVHPALYPQDFSQVPLYESSSTPQTKNCFVEFQIYIYFRVFSFSFQV
ncbi:unnamed protein product [Paramecium octaurelia]|uniref:Uncharacterized protein n=1 Tax=Paramecium octaurelia TaxID=43137 RepID=A0A8S1T0H0_PAROT|nr:unnamed protein product [Paramecium octaurelia]